MQPDQPPLPPRRTPAVLGDWHEVYNNLVRDCTDNPSVDTTKIIPAFEKVWNGTVDFDELPLPTGVGREISVPLQRLDKCAVCAKTDQLRLCNSCASVIYCSRECQRFDWRVHRLFCSQTKQINLKVFYPFIAYMLDSIRRTAPTQERHAATPLHPKLESVFNRLGRRAGPRDPDSWMHPALCHQVIKAPTPGPRKATQTDKKLHHTVVLGNKYDLQIHTLPDPGKLSRWWKGKSSITTLQLYVHVGREQNIFEVTVAVCLVLLSEVYSTYIAKSPESSSSGENSWESRGCFRLEYGQSPVSDFGICKGRIHGKASRVQTWTYYQSKDNRRKTILDPDKHYWLYFRTIKGEELVLDCCSFPYGMEGCVDAAPCLKNLSYVFRDHGSSRTPAHFYAPHRPEECPISHSLVEEARFSVMHNTSLYGALGWEVFGGRDKRQHAILREFMNMVHGTPCTLEQEERVRDYRSYGAVMLGQVLSGRYWKEWAKPLVYSRDDCFDVDNPKYSEYVKGSQEDPTYNGKANGMMGLFGDALGIN